MTQPYAGHKRGRTRCAAGLALCLELFGCSNPKARSDRPTYALRTRTEIAGAFTSSPEPFGKRCTAQKDAKQARTLVSCDAGEVLVMLPGLGWIASDPYKDEILDTYYYLQSDSEGDYSPATSSDDMTRRIKVTVFVAEPNSYALDAAQYLKERYKLFTSFDPNGTFYRFSKPEPWLDAEPPVLAYTGITNPNGGFFHDGVVTTVRRRSDGRLVVYEVIHSVDVTVWGGPQPRHMLERIRDYPKSFWVFDRDGKQLP